MNPGDWRGKSGGGNRARERDEGAVGECGVVEDNGGHHHRWHHWLLRHAPSGDEIQAVHAREVPTPPPPSTTTATSGTTDQLPA